ncbi:MAG: carboxypeptidase regulatory-like domain-containing protein, partial [Blastocatellia bacterium]
MNRTIHRVLSALFITLALTSAALAQNSTLRGQVLDERGDAIPNADITLTGKDGKERKAKSGVTGDFSIQNVPSGAYTLTSSYQGFQTRTINELKTPYSGVLSVKMAIAAVEVITDVSANNTAVSTEPDQNMNAITLTEKEIENLPDNEDDLRDFINALAGGGVNGQGATILVDGFSGGRLPPREAIARIVLNQNPFSAEYSNPGFGRAEIITKPGYGSWRGSGSFGYRNAALDARNAFALVRPDLAQQRYDFFMGGPLLKKRLSTSLFSNRTDVDGSSTTVAKILDGNLAEIPFVDNVPSKTVTTFVGGRADYLINNSNTLNVSYNFRTSETMNQEFGSSFRGGGGFGFGPGGGGGGGFGGGGGGGAGSTNLLPGSGSNRENTNHNLRVTETWIINAKMIHEARLQYQRDRSNQQANTNGLAINVLDSFIGGGSSCCPNIGNSDSVEYQDYLTVTLKKHTIKGGIQFEYEKIHDLSGGNFNGTYTFSSLDQYRLALRALKDPTAPRCDPAAPIDPRSGILTPCATQFTINQGNTLIDYSMFRGSWFITDDFRVSPSLTLSYGLRHEFQSHLVDKLNFAPRSGIAWSPFKSRKTTIRGGVGIFFDRLSNGSFENTIRFNGVTQQSFTIRNARFNPDDPLSGGQLVPRESQTTRILDPNLNAPYSFNASVSIEQQLPKGFTGAFTYFHDRGIHQFRTRNINAPDPITHISPNPLGGIIYQFESSARSETNRLDFNLNRRLANMTFFGRYTLAWMNSDSGGIPADSYNLAAEWGRAGGDRRHNASIGGFLTLPKGFRMTMHMNVSSGAPFNITTGRDENGDGSVNDRPAGLGRNANLTTDFYSQLIFDRSAGARAPGKTLREFLTEFYPNGVIAQGPGNFNVNTSLSKTFGFGKRNGNGQQAQANQGGGFGEGGRGGRGGGGGGGGGGG